MKFQNWEFRPIAKNQEPVIIYKKEVKRRG